MQKFLADTLLKPFLSRYLRRERSYSYKGFGLRIFPGVFHPAFFFSSKYLFGFVEQLDLAGKACLEIGCGSGLISLLMARKQALVTAIDISAEAVRNTHLNFERNKKSFSATWKVLRSDLFEQTGGERFDVIVINPPYFFKAVESESQHAWNCGAGGEYFQALFSGLSGACHPQGQVYMVLADNCDIDRIAQLAKDRGWELNERDRRKIGWETNFIYAIEPLTSAKIG